MVTRVLLAVFSLALLGCATTQPGRVSLNPTEATRLADLKAQSMGEDLRCYDRAPAKYDNLDKSWWVSYVRKGKKYADFNLRVEDKTRKAWLVVP